MTEKKIKKEENDDEILLSPKEVTDVLDVAYAATVFNSNYFNGILTPSLLNQAFKDITLNPTQATEATLTASLKAPKDNEKSLQEFSQDFEIQSQIYKKLLSYLGNLLAFDITYSSDAEGKQYKSAKYKKDLKIVKDFLTRFNYKQEFATVVQEMLRNDAYFGCPRGIEGGDKIVLQELPNSIDYTMITGKSEYGFLFAFNMGWFLESGVDIDMYPPYFKKLYSETFKLGEEKSSPNQSLVSKHSSWAYWSEIDQDIGWCWKMNTSQAVRLPFYSGLFLDLLSQPTMRTLQKSINMSAASKMLIGEIPLLDKTQSSKKDQFALSAENLGRFLSVVKQAIGDGVKTAAVPLSGVQPIDFDTDNEMYSAYLRTVVGASGVNANLIFSTDVRPNSVESQLSLNVDEAQMMALYPAFESFIEYHVNKLTNDFKFAFRFEGTNFFNNRQQRFDKATGLAALGMVLPQKIAASIGMNVFEFQSQLEEAQESKWVDKLTPIVSSFQQGKEDAGAPKKDDGDLTDSGSETRDAGSNEANK